MPVAAAVPTPANNLNVSVATPHALTELLTSPDVFNPEMLIKSVT